MRISQDELHWKQRSRVNWLAQGDRNTNFCHAFTSERRQKNLISGLINCHGDCCTEDSSITDITVDYFSNLFGSSYPSLKTIDEVFSFVPHKVTVEMNSFLCTPFTNSEVRKALFDMHPSKAPGPDGFTILFFQWG